MTSYGGQIKYTVGNTGISRGNAPTTPRIPGADVRITGKGMSIVYSLMSPMLEEEVGIRILETWWNDGESGAPVSRDQLMSVLASVSLVYDDAAIVLRTQI